MAPQRRQRTVDIDFTLKRSFGKSSFRPVQREVIQAALDGHDIFLQAATSFGKSLCFQLPAVVDYGITIVVSPLLALMNNQVSALKAAGIRAATINSTTPKAIKDEVIEDLRCGHPLTRLLYVTPEWCGFDSSRKMLALIHEQGQLSRIAVDEAHCISEWGHDFRPAFQNLCFFKRAFPDVPVMCLTATATQRVRNDIVATLALNPANLKMYTMTTSRPNLHYQVRFTCDDVDQYDDFLPWIQSVYGRRRADGRADVLKAEGKRIRNVSGIIYTLYRKDCEALAARLVNDGIGAKPFHAGLSNAKKDDHLNGWVANLEGYDVIVATTAFGMGIDKDNVRFVVHWQLPKSFEGYYQEAGRAGRDGRASACILYYSREDRDRAFGMLAREQDKKNGSRAQQFGEEAAPGSDLQSSRKAKSLQALVDYCERTDTCRHKTICMYFGESADPECDYACDWHKDPRALARLKERDLASEEWCSTQRVSGRFEVDEYD